MFDKGGKEKKKKRWRLELVDIYPFPPKEKNCESIPVIFAILISDLLFISVPYFIIIYSLLFLSPLFIGSPLIRTLSLSSLFSSLFFCFSLSLSFPPIFKILHNSLPFSSIFSDVQRRRRSPPPSPPLRLPISTPSLSLSPSLHVVFVFFFFSCSSTYSSVFPSVSSPFSAVGSIQRMRRPSRSRRTFYSCYARREFLISLQYLLPFAVCLLSDSRCTINLLRVFV